MHELIRFSREVGLDFSLVQGTGGNTSMKDGTHLYVKASGLELKKATEESFAKIRMEDILTLYRSLPSDEESGRLLSEIALNGKRPSIEAYLHALLPHRYVFHLHCIYLNGITCREEGHYVAKTLFPKVDIDWAYVPYQRPGLALALNLENEIKKLVGLSSQKTFVAFLANHGMIVAADTCQEIVSCLQELMSKTEIALGSWHWTEPSKEDRARAIKDHHAHIEYALYPDHVIFCLSGDTYDHDFDTYVRYWKAHQETRELTYRFGGHPRYLPLEEIKFLGNWESEKFRHKNFLSDNQQVKAE